MDICRDSVVRRKRTGEPSKLYIDGCVMCLMAWLFRHTLVATPYKAYVKNEPYFKKWGGKIRYLKEKLDLLDDQEVFIDKISFEKRIDMIKEDHVPKVVSDKGSSSSTSKHEEDSDMNSVEQEDCFIETELCDSDRRRKMKGKEVQDHESRGHWIEPKSPFKIRNLVLERREKQKKEVEAKFEELFGKRVSAKKTQKSKKEKSKPTITSMRRSGRLSATSVTSSSLSPDSKYN
ncbi:hypothetical protein ZOSMA_137G00040 [Zostera marina]|uniref:Uncharacterized protein n=1 Tax=Zostera marina TaxID=29655 RepID=A0A0K9PYH5_ZOSMR|nr:hypothetical protein ZOSMA_137G00040 [Zostera marina]